MNSSRPAGQHVARAIAEIAIASLGCALVACAVVANQRWLDRHFLPSFFLPRGWYVRVETGIRIVLAAFGALLALVVRPRLGRSAAAAPERMPAVAIAAVLALGAGELALRRVHLQPVAWLVADEEPRRQPDPTLGWTLVPARVGRRIVGGRTVEYAIDAAGCRVRSLDRPVDPDRPTIVFAGESVIFGEGLTWEESIPAQVGALTGIQTANLAVHGYGNDQAYLRVRSELPRFRRPTAVVSLFMTALFGRNVEDDRPHLGPGLAWLAPERRGKLASLAMLFVPYRTDEDVANGVTTTRDVLRATAELARARGARAITLVLQLGPEAAVERALRRRILDDAGIEYLFVEVDAPWRLPWDRHPNARAAHLIASAIAARLGATPAM